MRNWQNIHCVLFERWFLDIVQLQTLVTVYLTIASAKKHLTLLVPARLATANLRLRPSGQQTLFQLRFLPSSMTKQSNFDDVPFSKPGRAARTWLVQKTLRGMEVATPSLNWISLSSTSCHGVSVLASGRLPHVGHQDDLSIVFITVRYADKLWHPQFFGAITFVSQRLTV